MKPSEQLLALAGDCLDDPLRVIGAKVALLEDKLKTNNTMRSFIHKLHEEGRISPSEYIGALGVLIDRDLEEAAAGYPHEDH